MEDIDIIRLYFDRSEQAIEETDHKYGAGLRSLSMRMLRNREDAKECCNDTYLKTWNTILPNNPLVLYAYVMKICRCISCNRIDWYQAKKRKAIVVELTSELENCIPDRYAEKQMQDREIGELVNQFLKRLSAEKRIIFMKRYWYAESIGEIAKELQITEGKVKMSLSRMKSKLKEYLEMEGIKV